MIEIVYNDNRELAGLEGKTVAEVRKEYGDEFDIPGRAQAVLNGVTLKKKLESETRLDEGDELRFIIKSRIRTPMLVTALLLALALTSGVFAYTYITDSTSFLVSSAGADFAAVSANTSSSPSWTTYGFFRGAIGNGTLFDIDTTTSGYTGDLVATVSIANGDVLSKVYRVLVMKIEAYDGGSKIDINSDNTVDGRDFALLTLRNGAVDLFINQTASGTYNVKLVSGYYVSNIWGLGWGAGDPQNPNLFMNIGQR